MQTKSKETRKKYYVTKKNIIEWCWAISGILPTDRYFRSYVHNWNVRDKILSAKKNGTFDDAINRPMHSRSVGIRIDMRYYLKAYRL